MIDSIIFDLDGVICSTDEYHYLGWQKLADDLGIYFDRKINERLRGVSRMASLEIVLERADKQYTDEEKLAFATQKNETYRSLLSRMSPADLTDEVKNTLDELRRRGYMMAIGSSSKNAKFILERIGLSDYFDAVSDGTNITHSKPDPEVFLKAAQFLGKTPATCLVVEDAEAGIDAAKAGNMAAAGIGSAKTYERDDYRLETFSDLLKILPDLHQEKEKIMNIGVVGAGTIAGWVSDFLEQIEDRGIIRYAVATEFPEEGKRFAERNGWRIVYNTVDEMLNDPKVDLVYVAVPNNAHYDVCMQALNANKPVVVEKPFAVNDTQAKAMIALAEEKGLFISEAIWPSFLPSCKLINDAIASGEIGELKGGKMVSLADVMFLERVKKLETGGGALMDMGPYMLGRVCDHFGLDIQKVTGSFEYLESGVDARDFYTIEYPNGVKVECISTINTPRAEHEEYGEIYGTKGTIRFDAMANPRDIQILDLNGNLIRKIDIPAQLRGKQVPFTAGYEHEWLAFADALRTGKTECAEAPHAMTLKVSEVLTALRRQAKVIFPFE